jgi:hypothetical protein
LRIDRSIGGGGAMFVHNGYLGRRTAILTPKEEMVPGISFDLLFGVSSSIKGGRSNRVHGAADSATDPHVWSSPTLTRCR